MEKMVDTGDNLDPLEQVTGEMPEARDDIIEPVEPVLRDRDGRNFDPTIHLTDDAGRPKFNKSGTLKKRHKTKASVLEFPGARPGTTPIEAGKQIAEAIFATGQLFGGEEFAPTVNKQYGIDERAQMHDAWGRFCEAKNINDIPPGIAVTVATIGYLAPRLFMPKTKSRISRAKTWITDKYNSWREKRAS